MNKLYAFICGTFLAVSTGAFAGEEVIEKAKPKSRVQMLLKRECGCGPTQFEKSLINFSIIFVVVFAANYCWRYVYGQQMDAEHGSV